MPEVVKRTVEAYWDKKESEGGVNRLEFKPVLSWMGKDKNVLDVGCGDGALGAQLMEKKGCTVSGIDLSEKAVKIAKEKGLDSKVCDLDMGLPFKDDEFDVCVAVDVLEHVYRPLELLKECKRVAPVIIMASPNMAYIKARLQLLGGRFPKAPLFDDFWHDTQHIHLFSYKDLLDGARSIGLRPARTWFWTPGLPEGLVKIMPNLLARVFAVELIK